MLRVLHQDFVLENRQTFNQQRFQSTVPRSRLVTKSGPSLKRRFAETLLVKTSPLAVIRVLHQDFVLENRQTSNQQGLPSTVPRIRLVTKSGPSSKRRFSETLLVKTSPLAVIRVLHQDFVLENRQTFNQQRFQSTMLLLN